METTILNYTIALYHNFQLGSPLLYELKAVKGEHSNTSTSLCKIQAIIL